MKTGKCIILLSQISKLLVPMLSIGNNLGHLFVHNFASTFMIEAYVKNRNLLLNISLPERNRLHYHHLAFKEI